MNFLKSLLMTGVVIAIPVGAAMAQDVTATSTTTVDVNKAAPSVEVRTTTYSYDMNNDGVIGPNEFTSYVTRTYDTNNDGYILLDEYDPFTEYAYASHNKDDIKSYTFWDKDKDNRLDSDEVNSMVSDTGIYKKWDFNENGTIENSEFAKGTFMAYDDDNNGTISMEEWEDVVM